MMLDYAIISGRSDILEHLLKLGANPHNIDPNNNIHELINDNEINKKIVRQMEKIFTKYGFNVDLHDEDNSII